MKKPETSRLIKLFKPEVSVRILCQVALLIALAFVLERQFAIVNLPEMRISFSFIPMMVCGMLFGPVWGGIAYGLADILGWPMMIGAPVPLILVSRIVNGFLFGLFLYRENLKMWPHSVLNSLSTQIICAMGLTTLGLALVRGAPYIPLLITRLPQVAIFIVLQIVIFPVLLKVRDALRKAGHITLNRNSIFKRVNRG